MLLPLQQANADVAIKALFDTREFTCLVKNIYYEARGEPIRGQKAVALVTLNRVASKHYPDTVCGNVYKKHQFTWTANKNRKVTDKKAWARAEEVAYAVLSGNHGLGSFKATHFHTKQVSPNWGLKRKAVIGNHIFY